MKVGIITWFQYENYGTKLQALALQAFLRNEGYDTQLINYDVPEVSQTFKKNTLISRLFDKIKYILLQRAKRLFSSQLKIRSLRMKQVISDYCVLSPHIASDEEYVKICNQFDIIICGSDQIWNPNWYHRYYYADFPEIHVKKVSYAPSLGINKIPEQIVPLMKKSLASFSRITVREENAIDLLEPLIGYRPQKVIDPTMLFSGQQWQEMFHLDIDEDRYILCYFLSDNRHHWKAARDFAHEHHLCIKILPHEAFSFFQNGEIHADAGIKEFLELILNADYIITDSFHGAVFSILFNKEFILFERFRQNVYSSQNDRVLNLVRQFNLEDHLLAYNSSCIEKLNNINYERVMSVMTDLRQQSAEILSEEIAI